MEKITQFLISPDEPVFTLPINALLGKSSPKYLKVICLNNKPYLHVILDTDLPIHEVEFIILPTGTENKGMEIYIDSFVFKQGGKNVVLHLFRKPLDLRP